MDKKEKERLSKYGKLVCDFANSKNTDDILTSFFENLQSAFYFSSDFKEKALKQYPTKKKTINSLSFKEKELFELLLKRNKIFKSCNSAFNNSYANIDLYNTIDSMFTISEREWQQYGDTEYIDKTFLIPAKEIEAYIDKTIFPEEWQRDLNVEIKTLIELSHQLGDIELEDTNRYKELEIMSLDYPAISRLHDYVGANQAKLKTVLLQIIKSEQAFESEGFKSMLLRYNRTHKKMLIVNEDNKTLAEIGTFLENHFLKDITIVDYINIFNAPISYCLIEYLKNTEYCGKERLTVCPKCNCIFSKSRLNGQQKYCPVCSRKNKMTPEERNNYQKQYRENPTRKKAIAKAKREEKIRHYMANAGKTRKQAEIIVDNEM